MLFRVLTHSYNFKKTGMKDAWWEKGSGYGATYHNGWLSLRLDHVL